jgi:hypothetical protein
MVAMSAAASALVVLKEQLEVVVAVERPLPLAVHR